MKTYTYKTVTLGYTFSTKRGLTKRLQESLTEEGSKGWRLVKFDFCDDLNACVIVYERENG